MDVPQPYSTQIQIKGTKKETYQNSINSILINTDYH
jgi:hypothetical protein